MFGKIITGFFWDTYDNLGKVLLSNIIWFFCNLPGFTILFGVSHSKDPFNLISISLLFISILLFCITTSGLYHLTYLFVEQKDISIKELFKGMKKYAVKGTLVTFIFIIFLIILLINIQFYIRLESGLRWMGAVLAGLAFWVCLLSLLVYQYIFPLMVRQNPPIKKLIYRSILLTLANLRITLLVASTTLGLLILTLLTGVGPVLFTMSILTLFGNNAVYELLAQYDKKPETEIPLKHGEKPTSWHQILKKEEPKWRHDNRGWKDILRPWDV